MNEKNINDDDNQKITEEKILLDIYHNMLYPPPIGKYSKDLIFDSSLNMTNLTPLLYKNKPIIIGDGSFSKVQLYMHKKNKIKYAVKKMNLLKIEKLSQNKKLLHNEINIQGRINHPNIIRLYNFYKYNNNCYLILEYASQGTLFDMIRKKSGFTERIAFYYFIQTLNAIYFLHLHSIIHRDLKPENLLINENNILKLCDFGWTVKLNSSKRRTFCGTVEYMAPEIIKKQKYDETIDIWSLGVLLYELVHSYSPFFSGDSDIKKIGNNIVQNELTFKEGLSDEYKDLVKKILIKDSSKRIKIEEIYQHPFMTKHINTIYREINSNINTLNINNNEKDSDTKKINNLRNNKILLDNKINLDNNSKKDNKTIGEIIYKKNEKMKNKGCFYKKVKINPIFNINKLKNNNKELQDTNSNKDKDKIKRDTNFIFASVPTEPEPKLLPDSPYYKEIKKIKTNFYNEKQNNTLYNNKEEPFNNISNTSRNNRNIIEIKKEGKIKTLFKNQNKISHVKSFSLGQNEPTSAELKDNNRFKIIISINNTQNRNYINKKKYRKIENLSTKSKRSISNYLEDNYLQSHSNLGIYNKNNSRLHQTMNKNRKNNSSKKNKSINQTYLFEHKHYLNSNSNNNIIEYNPIDCSDLPYNYDLNRNTNKNSFIKKNYIKTDNNNINNNSNCHYISMVNNNSTNNFSNIIINNNNNQKYLLKAKNVSKLKKIVKKPNPNNKDDSIILRRINSDSYQKIYITNNNTKKKSQIITKIKQTKNLSKYNENNVFSKNNKSSIINKIIDRTIKKDLNKTVNINNSIKYQTDNKISSNKIKNLDINMKNQNNFHSKLNSNNIKNKNKKYIELSNSNKTMDKQNPKIIEINNSKNSKILFSELKSKTKIKKFNEIVK